MPRWITQDFEVGFFGTRAAMGVFWAGLIVASGAVGLRCASIPKAEPTREPARAQVIERNPWISGGDARISVLSLNLFQRPWEREARLLGASQWISEQSADWVLLQEVSQGIGPWKSDPVRSILDRSNSFDVFRGWHELNLGVYQLGLATLSRQSIAKASSRYQAFRQNDFLNTKGFLVTHIPESPLGEWIVINVHLTHRPGLPLKEAQFAELTAAVNQSQDALPHAHVLLGGDFNATLENSAFQGFLRAVGGQTWETSLNPEDQARGTQHTPYTEKCDVEGRSNRIDHFVLVKPKSSEGPKVAFDQAGLVVHQSEPHISDHCALRVDLIRVP